MSIWSHHLKPPFSLRRIGIFFLLLQIFTLRVDQVLAGAFSSTRISFVASTPALVSVCDTDEGYWNLEQNLSGQTQLLAQSQISPTLQSDPTAATPTSYPAPPSPRANPTDDAGGDIEEPYPEPGSREQPLLPYPVPTARQSSGVIQTPSSQDPSAPPAIGSNTSGNRSQDSDGDFQTSPAVSATILWIGFLASSAIFLSAIFWSILTYSRQRNNE